MMRNLGMVLSAMVIGLAADRILAGGSIYGQARFERIKGRPHMGYRDLYEWSLFLTPAHPTLDGISRRIGSSRWSNGACTDPCLNCGRDYCKVGLTPGTYSAFLSWPYLFTAPTVISNVTIAQNQTTHLDIEMPIDFSTYFFDEWTNAAPSWYQTFLAASTGIRGVAFSYAGPDPQSVTVTVLQEKPGESNPANWIPVGSATRSGTSGIDNWVRWRSGEVRTTPGLRYAVKLAANNGMLQPYRRSKDGNSYADGRAYLAGQSQPFDLNVVVFNEGDGTIVTMNSRCTYRGRQPADGAGRAAFGQTFKARGHALAAADCILHWDTPWDSVVEWKVRQGGPTGPQVGVSRRVMGAWDVSSIHGVSFNPGEVPLTPGQTYFIEMRLPYGGVVNPYFIADDRYDDGRAYKLEGSNWVALPLNDDLNMTIIEYPVPAYCLEIQPPFIHRTVDKGSHLPSESLNMINCGTQEICYSVNDNVPWLGVSPSSGCIPAGSSQALTISFNTAGLPKGYYQGAITVQSPPLEAQTVTVTVDVTTAPGDHDGDGDVDQADFGAFQICLTGPGVIQDDPDCRDALLDGDEDVDQDDFGIFQRCISGPNRPAAKDCAQRE